jgi:hypothetical protein
MAGEGIFESQAMGEFNFVPLPPSANEAFVIMPADGATAVPEPSSVTLIVVGLLGMFASARRAVPV